MKLPETRIKQCFEGLAARGEKGFIAYISAGDPSLEATIERVLRLEEAGVDVVELGMPFSDPLADGPVNQEANYRALQAGATLPKVLDTIYAIRERSQVPILVYSYMNPWVSRGFERTAAAAAKAGIDGVLPLDLSAEESKPFIQALWDVNLDGVMLVTPTSSDERIGRIVSVCSGFVYCVSRMGVTGMRKTVQKSAGPLVQRIRKQTSLPVALGFGVSSPEQARENARHADAVVVGSAIVNRLHEAGATRRAQKEAYTWIASLVEATKSA